MAEKKEAWTPQSPWRIVGARTMVHIHDAMGYIGVTLSDKTPQDRRRNEYLVNAVNSHDELVSLLQRLTADRVKNHIDGLDKESSRELCAILVEAQELLARVEAE